MSNVHRFAFSDKFSDYERVDEFRPIYVQRTIVLANVGDSFQMWKQRVLAGKTITREFP